MNDLEDLSDEELARRLADEEGIGPPVSNAEVAKCRKPLCRLCRGTGLCRRQDGPAVCPCAEPAFVRRYRDHIVERAQRFYWKTAAGRPA